MKVPLTRGLAALVDDDAVPIVGGVRWCAVKNRRIFYAKRLERGRWVMMHRLIVGATDGEVVDHINGDGLDNRRANLRVCTVRQNSHNSRTPVLRGGKSSRFKGVYYDARGYWCARIRVADPGVSGPGRRVSLGCHKTEDAAAHAYDDAAAKYFGAFARLNFSKETGP